MSMYKMECMWGHQNRRTVPWSKAAPCSYARRMLQWLMTHRTELLFWNGFLFTPLRRVFLVSIFFALALLRGWLQYIPILFIPCVLLYACRCL